MKNLDELIKTHAKIPSLLSFSRPVFIGTHPDDIEFGCGGIISKFKELNIPVTYIIVTDGSSGSNDPTITAEMLKKIRKKESINAAKFMNVSNIEFLDFPDGGLFEVEDIIQKLCPVLLKYNPDIIFAPDSNLSTECHADHIKVGIATRYITQIVPYPEALKKHNINIENITGFPNNLVLALYFSENPNIKIEISEKNLNEKIQSLNLHKSQIKSPSIELLVNYFKLKAKKLGEDTNTGLAEEYQVLVPFTQHIYSEGFDY